MIGIEDINKLFKIKFVRDTGFTISSHFLVGISGLLLNTIIGNSFGVDGLGVVNQGLAIYMLLALVANFGIQTSAQKHTSEHMANKDLVKSIFTTAVIATLISSLVVVAAFLLFIYIYPALISSERLMEIVRILIFAVPLFALNKTVNNFMTGLREMKIYSIIRVIRWLTIILMLVLIKIFKLPLVSTAYAFIFSEVLILFFFFFKTSKYLCKIDLEWIKRHFSFGVKSIMADFVATFNTKIPILIIGYTLGDEAAGYYSYIEVFAFSILMISASLQKNFNPIFTMLWHNNDIDEIKVRIKKVFKILTYLLIPLLVAITILYYVYTLMFMDASYLNYSDVLFALTFGISIRFLFGPFFTFLIMADFLNANLLRVSLNAFINFVLLLLLIEPFGIMGVAIAFGASMLVDLLLLNYLYKKNLNLNLFKIISASYK